MMSSFRILIGCVFVGLQINDIEPFCQDEIALYKQCAERRVSFSNQLLVEKLFVRETQFL